MNTPLSFLDPARPEPWASFLEQIDRVAPYLGKVAYWLETIKHPKRILIVDVPIHRDDGSLAHYEGYRVQHNVSRGPGKGGVRVTPATLSRAKLERVTHRYTSEIGLLICGGRHQSQSL